MIVVYYASINWGPIDPNNNLQICVIDPNSGCFEPNNRVWLFINVIFVVLLIFSIIWTSELKNNDNIASKILIGVLLILGGVILSDLSIKHNFSYDIYIIPFWLSVVYIMIWLYLSLFTITSND